MLEGSCHCGAITVELETELSPSELPVRLCGCTFCIKHNPRYTSDPSGHLTIEIAGEQLVRRYRFGLALADFLICTQCGVFVAAYEPGSPGRAVINLLVLASSAELVAPPTRFAAYDTEDVATRTARRAKNWTPATLRVGRRSP
ncbi:MAG: GFA family protein [Kofleriaceae bacterium]